MAPRKPKPGRSLAEVNPLLAGEWSPRNGDLTPGDVTVKSSKKVWWLGECGHEWEAAVYNRSNGAGCPFCVGRLVLSGFNDLATTNPDLAREWHPEKNGDLTPADVVAGSAVKVWWQCGEGHEWEAVIANRLRGSRCLYCINKAILPGVNDLATVNPALAREWNEARNTGLDPSRVSHAANKKVWWACQVCGYEWEAFIAQRHTGAGCPVCAGKVIKVGFNDLAAVRPDLAQEWFQEKNGELTPADVTAGTSQSVWWKCSTCEHSWQAQVTSRTRRIPSRCPKCAARGPSLPETELYESLKRLYPNAVSGDRDTLPGRLKEVDIWLPDRRIGIEFNGEYHHDETRSDLGADIRDRHERKLAACHELGVPLIVVWEDDWNLDPEQVLDDLNRLINQLGCDACRRAITGVGPHPAYSDGDHSCKTIGGVAPHIPHLYTHEARRCGGHRKGYHHSCDEYSPRGEGVEYDLVDMGCWRQIDRGLELEDEWQTRAWEHPKRAPKRPLSA